MKSKKLLLPLVALLGLAACAPTTTAPTESVPPTSDDEPVKPSYPDDSLFDQHDEIEDFYENGKIATFQAPDPFVLRANGWYYLYYTTGGAGIRAYKSKDLMHWQTVRGKGCTEGFVYEYSKDEGHPKDSTPYAPEVIYHNGHYYMVASPSGNGHYIFRSPSPEGPFKAITGNIKHSIDGNFFIDSDHQLYMTYAGVGAINIAKMNGFTEIAKESGVEAVNSLTACRVGSWNEGGFILQKDGNYYVTFTGTHYLSSSYRVDYAYVPAGKSIFKSSSYENKGGVLLATQEKGWRGLGHSSTVLGPDLDSYYIAYHNLGTGSDRYLNFSRLSFNGGRMVANYVGQKDNPIPNRPAYEAWDDSELEEVGSYYLLDNDVKDTFTIEWNAVGDGKMVFDFIDDANYKYIGVTEDLTLGIFEVAAGIETLVTEATLFDDVDLSVLHTLRLSYKDGLIDLYYDGVQKLENFEYDLTGGKVGYDDQYDEYGYTGISTVGQGSSDKKAYNQDLILANAYDEDLSYLTGESGLVKVKKGEYLDTDSNNLFITEKNDRATYRIYSPVDSDYNVDLRVPASARGATIGIQIDNGPIRNYTIDDTTPFIKTGDSLIRVANDVYIPEGQHYISLYNVDDEFGFSMIDLTPRSVNESISVKFNNNLSDKKGIIIGDYTAKADRIEFGSQRGVGYVDRKYIDGDQVIEATMGASSFDTNGALTVAFNAQEFSLDDPVDGANYNRVENYKGMKLDITSKTVSLSYVRFEENDFIAEEGYKVPLDKDFVVRIEIVGKTVTVYIDDEEILSTTYNLGTTYGAAGLLAENASGYFKSLTVNPYEE